MNVLTAVKRHFPKIDEPTFLILYKTCQTSSQVLHTSPVSLFQEGHWMFGTRSKASHEIDQRVQEFELWEPFEETEVNNTRKE